MYVLPLESVYGVFGAAGQRLVEVGVVGVVEESTTGVVVVPGGAGVVGTTDDGLPGDGPADDGATDDTPTDGPIDGGPTDDGPTDDGPIDDGPTDDGPTDDGPTDAGALGVDSTNDGPTEVDSTGPVGATGVIDPTGIVGTPGVVDAIGVVAPTEVAGSTGLVAGLVPVLVSTILEPSESVVVIAMVKVFGIVDCTGAVVVPVIICTTVEPSEFVVVYWDTEVDGPLDVTLNKVPSRSAPQHSATSPLQDVQVSPSGSAASPPLLPPQLHVSPMSHQRRPLRMG